MNIQEKTNFIFEKLKPHGLYESNAYALAGIEGIIELLSADRLPYNNRARLIITPSDGKVSPNRIGKYYRQSMANYLSLWIKVPNMLTWTTYEALANYCDEKASLSMKELGLI
jgi:hypothetical protein